MITLLPLLGPLFFFLSIEAQTINIDFSGARFDEKTGSVCVTREICIPNAADLAPECESDLGPGCDCREDSDCVGENARCVACKCQDCPESARTRGAIINPPLTFLVDTTKSVKPDKHSIFNLTQKVVRRIQETQTNIPLYTLVTFNDFGPDFDRNSKIMVETEDVIKFREMIVGLQFESYDGGRDSKERLTQGLLKTIQRTPDKSLVVVFTDNGSKDLKLKNEIMRIKAEKELEIYIVLTPIYEGYPNDKSLGVYKEMARVFNIAEVGADVFLTHVEVFEEENCI